MRVLAAILFVASTAYACQFSVEPRVELDLPRYQGRWYLIETGPLGNSTGPLNCVYEEYLETNNPFVFNLNWHGQTNNGSVLLDTGVVTIPRAKSSPANWNFYLDGTVFNSKIIATDYTNWAIEYTCHESINYERFMIRSRGQSLNADVQATLKSVIAGFGVDIKDFAQVSHSNCL